MDGESRNVEVKLKIGVDGASVRTVDAAAGSVLRLADAERELKQKVDDAARSMAAMNSAGVGPRSTVAERLAAFTPPGVPAAAGPLPTAPRLPVAQRLPYDPGPTVAGRPVGAGPTPASVERDAVGRVVADRTRLAEEAARVEAAGHDRVRAALEQRLRVERELMGMLTERVRLAGGFGTGEGYGYGVGQHHQYGGANRSYTAGADGGGHRWDRGIRELTERFGSALDRFAARGSTAVERARNMEQAHLWGGSRVSGFGDREGFGEGGGHGFMGQTFRAGGAGGGGGKHWSEKALKAMGVKPGLRGGMDAGWQLGMEAMTFAARLGQVDSTPFLSDRKRAELNMRSLPFGAGSLYGLTVDAGQYMTGNTRLMRGIEADRALDQFRAERQLIEMRSGVTAASDPRAMGAAADVMRTVRLDRPQGYDRGTVTGRRLHEEEERMLPAAQAYTKALREKEAATAKAAVYAKDEQTLLQRAKELQGKLIPDAQDELAKLEARQPGRGFLARNFGADPGLDPAVATQMDAIKRMRSELEANITARRDLQEKRKGADHEAAAAEARANEAMAGKAQSRYDVALARENRVVGQGERLAGMGLTGRMQGQFAVQYLQSAGIENAPAEIIAQAESYAPETVRSMKQAAGDKLIGEARRVPGLEAEYGDTIAGARKRTDKAREGAIEQKEGLDAKTLDEMRRLGAEDGERTAKYIKEYMDAREDKIKLDLQIQGAQRQANGG